MSAIQLWKIDPQTVPVPGPGSVLVLVNEAGQICSKTEGGAVVPVGIGPQGEAGPVGAQGAQGVPGPQGAQGPQGEAGPQGVQGPQGVRGDAGPPGAQGAPGPQGEAGPAGAQGAPGVPGPQGAKGDQGAQGPQGVRGDAGPPGAQGAQGVPGPQGVAGPVGPQGPQGVAGPAGNVADTLVAKAYSALPAWTTAQTVMMGFQPPDLSSNGGAIGFCVLGSNDHMTTAANLVIALRIGGVVRLTQTFALGTTAKTARAFRAQGRIYFEGGYMTPFLQSEVDAIAAQTGVGMGARLDVSTGSYVEVVAYLSAAVAGQALRCLGGFAYREF